jgi:3-oxoacyl-[acyl-carrier protein] reductase
MPRVLVTGGSRGLGKAAADGFKQNGWEVDCPSRAELDLADGDSVRAYCANAIAGGRLDALVHSAGVNWPRPLEQTSEEEWQLTLQVNLTAFRQVVQFLSPLLAGGRVVALGSILGLVARPNRAAYSASKAGLIGLVRALAIDLANQGTLINAVCPGYVETDMTRQNNTDEQLVDIANAIPLGRLGSPEEISKLVVWLCSQENTYITGQSMVIDGGFTCR